MADKKTTEQYYTRPPKLGKWEGFKLFLWNSETNQFLGRTAASWGKIILFYIIFYAALVGFFAAMLTVFYQTLDAKKPKWQLNESLIGSNPGLGFRPMPPAANVESTLIWYKASDNKSASYWSDELDLFLKNYNQMGHDKGEDCSSGKQPEEGKVCRVKVDYDPCIPNKKYNYNSAQGGPCIFLKLNKIYGWEPEYYDDPDQLPEKMPTDLKDHIKRHGTMQRQNHTVWVSCEGENPPDQENIGSIQYKPTRGFGGHYFPFKNTAGYLSPLVAVYFEKPARLGFRPMPPAANVESTLIWYKASDNKSASYWSDELDLFLKNYNQMGHDKGEDCSSGKQPEEGKVCRVKVDYDPCIPNKKYNYNSAQGGPCIFLKLNKIYGWEPEYYDDPDQLPEKMPTDLKDHIKRHGTMQRQNHTVWVSCEGENPPDQENIGSIQYKPTRGFGGHYFPFKNTAGYLSPLVAVYFEKPARGVLINIECKAWAKNIHHDRVDRRGSVHFELMIDN